MSIVNPSIAVLKFGSSVLRTGADLPRVVSEIYRHVRLGEHVVAVVSAFAGVTDRILLEARRWALQPNPPALASAVATGEVESATQLVFALERAGIPVTFLDPRDVHFRTHGERLDAEPVSIDVIRLRQVVEQSPVTVFPGFYGLAAGSGLALLGRGGSDLTAAYLAQRLGARCMLVKDVDGLYEADPARAKRRLRRFTVAHYADALKLGGELIQAKAIEQARSASQRIEIRALGEAAGTVMCADTSALTAPRALRPLRVALCGLGTVGAGVYEQLVAQPEHYDVIAILVRDSAKHVAKGIPSRLLLTDPVVALSRFLAERADVLIEAMGGLEPAYRLALGALAAGRSVITANKELLATHWDTLSRHLLGSAPRLLGSAAVGGAVPMMELVQRLGASAGIQSFRGVVNATCNFVLDRLADGVPFEDAVREAQEKGYAEPDPSADLDGTDAARKLEILCRLAFGAPPTRLDIDGIRSGRDGTVDARSTPATVCRLVASVGRDRIATVAPMRLPRADFLAQARGAENRLEVTTIDGAVHRLSGVGAGRYPTATAMIADLLDVSLARSGG